LKKYLKKLEKKKKLIKNIGVSPFFEKIEVEILLRYLFAK